MNIKNIPIKKMKEYENNSKLHTDSQIEAVKNSIINFGIKQPIVLDKNMVIIIGHCRYRAATEAGLETFPAIILDIPETEARALRIIDNKTNESEWDYEALSQEITALNEKIDLTELGFSLADIIYADEIYEPETLDFEGEEFYIENAQSQLKAKQLTISYKSEEEKAWIMQKLKTDSLKVVYQAKQLMEEL